MFSQDLLNNNNHFIDYSSRTPPNLKLDKLVEMRIRDDLLCNTSWTLPLVGLNDPYSPVVTWVYVNNTSSDCIFLYKDQHPVAVESHVLLRSTCLVVMNIILEKSRLA